MVNVALSVVYVAIYMRNTAGVTQVINGTNICKIVITSSCPTSTGGGNYYFTYIRAVDNLGYQRHEYM